MFSFSKKSQVIFSNEKTQLIFEDFIKKNPKETSSNMSMDDWLERGYQIYLKRKKQDIELGIVQDESTYYIQYLTEFWGLHLWNEKYECPDEVPEKELIYRAELILKHPSIRNKIKSNLDRINPIHLESQKDSDGFSTSEKYVALAKKFVEDEYSKKIDIDIDDIKINPNAKLSSKNPKEQVMVRRSPHFIKEFEKLFI